MTLPVLSPGQTPPPPLVMGARWIDYLEARTGERIDLDRLDNAVAATVLPRPVLRKLRARPALVIGGAA